MGEAIARRHLEGLTSEQRSVEAIHSIDSGFANHRLIETLLRPIRGMAFIDEGIRGLPDPPKWLRIKRINEIYSHVLLDICKLGNAKSLSWHAAQADPRPGSLIYSTDVLQGTAAVFHAKRAKAIWIPYGRFHDTA
jgi:hypothetical protein